MISKRDTAGALAGLLLVTAGTAEGQTPERCIAPDAAVGLDHVPIAVADLEALRHRLVDEFGFSTKPGRAHANGLENVHIKFEDGSGLELMTVGEPSDALAHRYAELIADGGGGAFLALSGLSADEVVGIAQPLEPEIGLARSDAFDVVSFPQQHLLHAVFFVDVHERAPDLEEQVTHRNSAESLEAVWVSVEQPLRLARLLEAFGGRDCGMSRHPEHLFGRAIGLRNGTVYLVDAGVWMADPGSAPVVSLTVSAGPDATPDNIILGEAGGLWIELRPRTGS